MVMFAHIPTDVLRNNKAGLCKSHLLECPAYRCAPGKETPSVPAKKQKTVTNDVGLVTIYKLVYSPENRAVYTGRTKDPGRRLAQHTSASSKCRLVRNAVRRYGRAKFAIEPLVRCSPEDADANESYYIMANGTMYPNGYNLRHGNMAGEETGEERSITDSASGIVALSGLADELHAQSEAVKDIAEICEDLEDCSATEDVCRQLLLEVHPDRAGERSFSATEVAAMLNKVRESVKG